MLPVCSANKAIALFRYLLNRRQRAACKEELLELPWPKARSSAAMHSLHVAVTTLRRYLDLMRCYWQLGRRTEALRQYTRCATILANDLGLQPMLELQELNRAIQSGCTPQQSKDGYGFAG